MYQIKAHAKVNIFLKITGHKEGYHTLISRFVRVEGLYDTIAFEPCDCEAFTIEGCEDVPLESNTLYKAYTTLIDFTRNRDIETFFRSHKVVLTKRIPSQAGLGGGSSDAAAFMRLCNEVCGLDIQTNILSKLGSTIGADLPFFIHNYPSANVSGFGEIVEAFEEETLQLELFTPTIGCDTARVYHIFKTHLLDKINPERFKAWEKMDSRTLLETIADPVILNDLYQAALTAYPKLKEVPQANEGWFFSGSGSTFFKLA